MSTLLKVDKVGFSNSNLAWPVILIGAKKRKELSLNVQDLVLLKAGEKEMEAIVHQQFREELTKVTVNRTLACLLDLKEGSEVEFKGKLSKPIIPRAGDYVEDDEIDIDLDRG